MQEHAGPEAATDVERWLGRNPPPAFARPDKAPKPIIDVTVERNDGQTADVALRMGVRRDGADPLFFVIYQRWLAKDDTWFFDPRAGAAPAR
jgi:hypothetical protein